MNFILLMGNQLLIKERMFMYLKNKTEKRSHKYLEYLKIIWDKIIRMHKICYHWNKCMKYSKKICIKIKERALFSPQFNRKIIISSDIYKLMNWKIKRHFKSLNIDKWLWFIITHLKIYKKKALEYISKIIQLQVMMSFQDQKLWVILFI